MPSEATVIESDPSKGIVIKDKNNNEWVWIEVPKSTVFTSATSEDQYDKIKADLIEYAKDYRNSKARDEWYDKYGVTYDGINEYSEVKYIQSQTSLDKAKSYYEKLYYDSEGKTEAGSTYEGANKYYVKIIDRIEDSSECGLTYNQYKSLYNKMLSSIYTNGGFWIGRYEAGISKTTPRTEKRRYYGKSKMSKRYVSI